MAKFGDIVGGFFASAIEATYGIAEPIASYLGMSPYTILILGAFFASIAVSTIFGWKEDDELKLSHGVGISGALFLWAFITIDYMKRMKGIEATTYLGKLIGDISGTTVYLFVMFLLLSYATVKLASKSEFLKKFTGLSVGD